MSIKLVQTYTTGGSQRCPPLQVSDDLRGNVSLEGVTGDKTMCTQVKTQSQCSRWSLNKAKGGRPCLDSAETAWRGGAGVHPGWHRSKEKN